MVKVSFAAAASGRSYFEKFLEALAKPDRATTLAVFQDIQLHGLDAKGCGFDRLKESSGKSKCERLRVVTASSM